VAQWVIDHSVFTNYDRGGYKLLEGTPVSSNKTLQILYGSRSQQFTGIQSCSRSLKLLTYPKTFRLLCSPQLTAFGTGDGNSWFAAQDNSATNHGKINCYEDIILSAH
jgi:hypothetical protein